VTFWFLFRERSLHCPLFETSKKALALAYLFTGINTLGIVGILSLGLPVWTGTANTGDSTVGTVVTISILVYKILQLPINFLATYIFLKPFILAGVSVSLSPVLRELLARTVGGLFLYVGSWISYYAWFYSLDKGCPCSRGDFTAAAIFPIIIYTCRALTVCISHRDDVPPRHQLARCFAFFKSSEQTDDEHIKADVVSSTTGSIGRKSCEARVDADAERLSVAQEARRLFLAVSAVVLETAYEELRGVVDATNGSVKESVWHNHENPMVLRSESRDF
jgi:hypothetical protein